MKIIHTADWHLGQTFYNYERASEHRIFLEWIAGLLKERETELLLIAGDVFDSPNPSAESQRMFYSFLTRITTANPSLKVVITAGNHDSAARLEAPNPLLESFNVHVSGIVHCKDDIIDYERMIIPVSDDTCCLAVPYLRHTDLPSAESYSEGVAMFYNELYNIAKEKYSTIIAMGHLQASGARISVGDNSEHAIIGGLDGIKTTFANDGFAYTALGHLHRAQQVGCKNNIRYSGSPLPMSFAERDNKQSVTEIIIENGNTVIEQIEFDTPVKLISLPKKEALPLNEVITLLQELPDGNAGKESPFLEVKVKITKVDPTMRTQIEETIAGKAVRLARIEAVSERIEGEKKIVTYDEFKKTPPSELMEKMYRNKTGKEMTPTLKNLLNEIIEEASK